MNTAKLSVENINYQGTMPGRLRGLYYENLKDFSYQFQFGKSYLLNSPIEQGAWPLCWIVGGALKPDSGTVKLNEKPYLIEDRKKDSWLVRYSEVKHFGFITLSVKSQIRHGLRTIQNQYLQSEDDLLNRFNLSPERYARPLRQLSSEEWRASCAIGLAHGRRIFCFPHIEHLRPGFIKEYRYLWFEEILHLLKSSGALVLIPSHLTAEAEGLCDELVPINR